MNKKRTHEEYLKMVADLYGSDFIVMDTYVNKRTKIKIKHKKCDYVQLVDPSYFLKGNYRCPNCRTNLRIKTNEKFVEQVIELVGNEYILLSEYTTAKTKVKMKHTVCGFSWDITPSGFLSGSRCPKCAGCMRKDTDIFKEEVYTIVLDEYSVIGEYINALEKIKFRHNNETCGNYEFEITPASFLSGVRCLKCAKNKKKNTEEYKREVFNLVGEEYEVLGEYVNSNTKIRMKHNICNAEYEVIPNNFINQKTRCRDCAYKINGENLKTSHEEFVKIIYNLVSEEYEVLGEYKNARTKVKIKHTTCGTDYEVLPTNFTDLGRRCPICAESKGEKRIRKWLDNNQVSFEPQKEFVGLIGTGGGLLSYDFYLPNENILIEYQGEFHDGSGGDYTKINLEYQQEHDKRKREYARSENIKLLEIWYWDFDRIEEIIKKELIEGRC